MRNLMRILFLFFLVGFYSMLSANVSEAGVNLPWSTTYNCTDWNTYSDTLNCDGLGKGGDWPACSTLYEQITSSANNPAGVGGKGQRHWIGDGSNVNSGGTSVSFNATQSEFWIRWYTRYQTGFQWNTLQYQKILYIRMGSTGSDDVYLGWYGSNGFRIYAQNGDGYGSGNSGVGTNCGWQALFPSGQSDGSWHYIEVHLKAETSGQSNGISELWIDGVKKMSATNRRFGNPSGWDSIEIGSNQALPANGGCFYNDFDDVAITNTGYIGPLSGTSAVPSPPTYLH